MHSLSSAETQQIKNAVFKEDFKKLIFWPNLNLDKTAQTVERPSRNPKIPGSNPGTKITFFS